MLWFLHFVVSRLALGNPMEGKLKWVCISLVGIQPSPALCLWPNLWPRSTHHPMALLKRWEGLSKQHCVRMERLVPHGCIWQHEELCSHVFMCVSGVSLTATIQHYSSHRHHSSSAEADAAWHRPQERVPARTEGWEEWRGEQLPQPWSSNGGENIIKLWCDALAPVWCLLIY